MKSEINSFWLRIALALLISLGLAVHGKKKKSLATSGAIAAIVVGFCSFATSYRFGIILIAFYYTGSKLTKVKEDIKAKLEDEYALGGQRNWIQVLANSVLATAVCITYYIYFGEDSHISFETKHNGNRSYLLILYISHYACAAADTWASELGILSISKPRLVTTFFLREVPPGTNGGMSILGTVASLAGGAFIGLVFWLMSFFTVTGDVPSNQFAAVIIGAVAGLLGSLFDSIMGATLQASYYSKNRKCIIKMNKKKHTADLDVIRICGSDVLTNEDVNFWSIALTCIVMYWLGPIIFCSLNQNACIL